MRKVENPSGYDLSEKSLMAYRTYASLYLDWADDNMDHFIWRGIDIRPIRKIEKTDPNPTDDMIYKAYMDAAVDLVEFYMCANDDLKALYEKYPPLRERDDELRTYAITCGAAEQTAETIVRAVRDYGWKQAYGTPMSEFGIMFSLMRGIEKCMQTHNSENPSPVYVYTQKDSTWRTFSLMTVMVEPSWQSAEEFPAITVYIGERRVSSKSIRADISSMSNDDIIEMVYRMVCRICTEYISTHGDRYADIGSDAAVLDMISDKKAKKAAEEWQYNIHIERAARLLSAEYRIPMQNAVKIWELIADLEQGMRENGISHAILSGNWERHMEIIENALGGKQ